MSALLCISAPVGVDNYTDMQGDSPKSQGWDEKMEIAGEETVGNRDELF